MGCGWSLASREADAQAAEWKPTDVFVFAPGLRTPTTVTFNRALQGLISSNLLDKLSNLRTRIAISGPDGYSSPHGKLHKKKASQHELQLALEDYLPTLLGLTREGSVNSNLPGTSGGQLSSLVEYGWNNRECEQKESVLRSSRYELVSVLHALAMVTLLQANTYLTPKPPAESYSSRVAEGYSSKVAEGDKKAAIELLLKAAQVLECAINVAQGLPDDIRHSLPTDLREGILRALQQQALGQGVEIQLGFAVDNIKASLAVKRRLACEQVKYWELAEEHMVKEPVAHDWGEKHLLFIRWKHAEAKATAFYFHGLILDEGQDANTHANAVACLQASQLYLKEGQKACVDFSSTTPVTRIPLPWGPMKYLTEKIPKAASSKARVNRDVYRDERAPETLPTLPEFPLALKAESFAMPPIDPAWSLENGHQGMPGIHAEENSGSLIATNQQGESLGAEGKSGLEQERERLL
eukprot:TRINITY_DN666_c0_g1_i4.p1 TRINITY_DN666_c0_g1~~TRINITY_DN666_c0_g1_i4.p1  ORF type:complete len:468 (-),score=80.29 TRINITY_DN666_c0_g1_i4:297-1700(-)